MALPKICTNKFFLMAVTAAFSFTVFTYGIIHQQVEEVSAEVSKRTEIVYKIPIIVDKVDKIDEKTDKLLADVSYIKGKIEKKS